MDDKIDKNAIKNLPTEVARKEASTWIKKLISKSQHSPPALTKNGGFEQQGSTATANQQPNQSAHVSRQRKSSEPHTSSPERQGVARRASRSISPTSPGRAQGVCTNSNTSTGGTTNTSANTSASNSGTRRHKQ